MKDSHSKLYGTIKELIPQLLAMDMDKKYVIEIKEPKSKRSLDQNRMMWKLIHTIAKETAQDDMEVYASVLERADVESEYIAAKTDLLNALRQSFRAVVFMGMNKDGLYIYKVFIGSSRFNTQQMSELIDICQQISAELGIPVEERYL